MVKNIVSNVAPTPPPLPLSACTSRLHLLHREKKDKDGDEEGEHIVEGGSRMTKLKDDSQKAWPHHGLKQVVTKRCRLSWLTNGALVYEPKCGGMGGVAGHQLLSTAVHRSPINFGDLTPYLTYGLKYIPSIISQRCRWVIGESYITAPDCNTKKNFSVVWTQVLCVPGKIFLPEK